MVNITADLNTEGAAPAIKVNSQITDKIKMGSIIFFALDDLNKEKNIKSELHINYANMQSTDSNNMNYTGVAIRLNEFFIEIIPITNK